MNSCSGNREPFVFVFLAKADEPAGRALETLAAGGDRHGAHGFSSFSRYTLNPEGPHDIFTE